MNPAGSRVGLRFSVGQAMLTVALLALALAPWAEAARTGGGKWAVLAFVLDLALAGALATFLLSEAIATGRIGRLIRIVAWGLFLVLLLATALLALFGAVFYLVYLANPE